MEKDKKIVFLNKDNIPEPNVKLVSEFGECYIKEPIITDDGILIMNPENLLRNEINLRKKDDTV